MIDTYSSDGSLFDVRFQKGRSEFSATIDREEKQINIVITESGPEFEQDSDSSWFVVKQLGLLVEPEIAIALGRALTELGVKATL